MNKLLERKIEKRVGKNAMTSDDCKTGVITGFTIVLEKEGTTEAYLKVKYLITFGAKPYERLRLVDEDLVVLLKEPNA